MAANAISKNDLNDLKNIDYGTVSPLFIQECICATIANININGTAMILGEIINRKLAVSLIPSLIESIKVSEYIPITGRKLICMHFNAYASLDTNELLSYLGTTNIPPYFLKEMFICAVNSSLYEIAECISSHVGLYREQTSWLIEFCSRPGEHAAGFKNLMNKVFEHPAFNPNYPKGDNSPVCLASRYHNYELLELLLKCQKTDTSDVAPYLIRETDDPIVLQMLLDNESLNFKDIVPVAMCDSFKMPQAVKIAIYEKNPKLDPSANNNYALMAACIRGQITFARYLLNDPRVTNIQHIFETIISLTQPSTLLDKYLHIVDILLQSPNILIRPETIRTCNSLSICTTLFQYLQFNGKNIQKYFSCAFGDMSLVSIGKKFDVDPLIFIQTILNIEPCLEFSLHADDWYVHELGTFYTNNKTWIENIEYESAANPLTIVAGCGYLDVFTRLLETNIDPSMYSNAALIAAAEKHKDAPYIRKNKDTIMDMLLMDVRVLICGIYPGKLSKKQTLGLTRKINSLLTPLLIAQKRSMVRTFGTELSAKVTLMQPR